jgi:quinohemoprotein ethanol dehydrogenase
MTFSPAATGPADVAAGKTVYDTACVFCHGEQGEGGHGGGPTLKQMKSAAVVLQTVSEGRRDMPSFGPTLTPAQIRDVAGYVTGKLAAP